MIAGTGTGTRKTLNKHNAMVPLNIPATVAIDDRPDTEMQNQ
jgi:hypothetical protein